MSQWTHIVGAIQCHWDKETAIKRLGKPVLWDDAKRMGIKYDTPEYEDYYENTWAKAFQDNRDGCGIPMGSEGSIDWYFTKTDEDYLGKGGMIAIQGDLRDYGGDKKIQFIVDWFIRATEDVRFATLTIRDEYTTEFVQVIVDWGHVIVARIPGEPAEEEESNG